MQMPKQSANKYVKSIANILFMSLTFSLAACSTEQASDLATINNSDTTYNCTNTENRIIKRICAKELEEGNGLMKAMGLWNIKNEDGNLAAKLEVTPLITINPDQMSWAVSYRLDFSSLGTFFKNVFDTQENQITRYAPGENIHSIVGFNQHKIKLTKSSEHFERVNHGTLTYKFGNSTRDVPVIYEKTFASGDVEYASMGLSLDTETNEFFLDATYRSLRFRWPEIYSFFRHDSAGLYHQQYWYAYINREKKTNNDIQPIKIFGEKQESKFVLERSGE